MVKIATEYVNYWALVVSVANVIPYSIFAQFLFFLGVSKFENRGISGNATNIDDISRLGQKNSVFYLYSAASPTGVEGACLTLFLYQNNNMYVQFFFPYTGGVLFRTYNWSATVWTNWKEVQLVDI